MKLTDLNWLLQGCSGRIQNLVYYQRNGKTFVRSASTKGYNKKPTEAQARFRLLFIRATEFAKIIIANPQLKASYAKRAIPPQNAYNLAMSEYMKQYKGVEGLRV
ncbi:MAG: hypothetical protein ABJA78_18060 [Ferruginibacter sp.]